MNFFKLKNKQLVQVTTKDLPGIIGYVEESNNELLILKGIEDPKLLEKWVSAVKYSSVQIPVTEIKNIFILEDN